MDYGLCTGALSLPGMRVPDHYKTLRIEPRATPQEIKRAYRTLAQQYHPDKTNDDPETAAHFAAIKEAYETLITPWKKQQYLEERWYAQSRGEQTETPVRTPAGILQEALRIDREMAGADVFRMNKDALCRELDELLNSRHMDSLRTFNDASINSQLIRVLCRPLRLLTPEQAGLLSGRLFALAGQDPAAAAVVSETILFIRRNKRAEQTRWIWIPVALGLLYLLIVFTRP